MMEQTLSDIIQRVFDPHREPSTYGKLADEIDHHGSAVILMLFALPSALPLPAAGYSTLLSLPLFLIGIRLLCGYEKLWLPHTVRHKAFRPDQLNRTLIHGMLRLVRGVERFSKPRLVAFVRSKGVRILLGILTVALACSMLVPIPGTNTGPAFGVFLLGFALLEDDGVLLIVGIFSSLLAMAMSLSIIMFGYLFVTEFFS